MNGIGASHKRLSVLLLGGTSEARELAALTAAEPGLRVISSLAGRVSRLQLPPGEVRIGGFGGIEGLKTWLMDKNIDVVVDATHPFAATITAHAVAATTDLSLPLLHIRRPEWTPDPGDRWIRVPTLAAAATALPATAHRVLLTIGRQGVEAFAGCTEPWFLIRSIDPPTGALPPKYESLCTRGPFDLDSEMALLSTREIDVVVSKNSGGIQTATKLVAARRLGLPVVMVDRPQQLPGLVEVSTAAAASVWLEEFHR